MLVLSKKQEKEMSLKAKKKSLNKKEQLQFILEGFPSIGPKSAKKLLEEVKTIRNIINADEESLKKVIGKKAEIVKRLTEENY
jgi:ERCC4-type nuclease